MATKVLITSAGAGPAVAVIKALKAQKELDLKIVSADMDPLAAGLYLADKSRLVPGADKPDFIKRIFDICQTEKVNIIIPIFDVETIVFADNAVRFEKIGVKVLVNNPEVVRTANDKLKTHDFCLKNGIVVPRIYSHQEVEEGNVVFPIIIKPIMGIGTKGVEIIEDLRTLKAYLPLKEGYFVQHHVNGIEYTIDTISDQNGRILAAAPRERIVVKSGQSVKGRTTKDKRLIEYGKGISSKFGIKWVACSQCKVTDDRKIFFIEINPRYGTGVSLSIGAGLNIPLLQIKLALGMPIKKEELDFTDNFYMIRYWEEILRNGKDLIKP